MFGLALSLAGLLPGADPGPAPIRIGVREVAPMPIAPDILDLGDGKFFYLLSKPRREPFPLTMKELFDGRRSAFRVEEEDPRSRLRVVRAWEEPPRQAVFVPAGGVWQPWNAPRGGFGGSGSGGGSPLVNPPTPQPPEAGGFGGNRRGIVGPGGFGAGPPW